jgi:hypothetical protein
MHSGVVRNAKGENSMSITSTAHRPSVSAKTGTAREIVARREQDADLDRLLGDKLLFDLKAPQKLGGPSKPSIYRARDAGLVEFVKNGNRSTLTRETMKKILTTGLGPIPCKDA